MISRISGNLLRKDREGQLVEVNVDGVGYEILLPYFVWRTVEDRELGHPVEFHTFYYVAERQPIPKLIGFTREIEREFFKKFITVPDIGPTVAAKALILSISTIARAIERGDITALGKLPGISKRRAEQAVATLRGKVVKEAMLADEHYDAVPEVERVPEEIQQEAIEALRALGFGAREAKAAVEKVMEKVDVKEIGGVEDLLREVFKLSNTL